MTIGRPNLSRTPNTRPGLAPDGSDPNRPGDRPLPDVFTERGVSATPIPNATATGQALDTARQAGGGTPNAPERRPPDPTLLDLSHGNQQQQASRLGAALWRRR